MAAMKILENKIPPPLVALICGGFMWFVSDGMQNPLEFGFVRISALLALCIIAAYFSISGLLAFRAAKTTVNPLKPELASSLVKSGVYQISRNPMYVGFAFLLLAWCLYLGSFLSIIGVLGFVLLIDRFQVIPEERAMSLLFGKEFEDYAKKVRRWF